MVAEEKAKRLKNFKEFEKWRDDALRENGLDPAVVREQQEARDKVG